MDPWNSMDLIFHMFRMFENVSSVSVLFCFVLFHSCMLIRRVQYDTIAPCLVLQVLYCGACASCRTSKNGTAPATGNVLDGLNELHPLPLPCSWNKGQKRNKEPKPLHKTNYPTMRKNELWIIQLRSQGCDLVDDKVDAFRAECQSISPQMMWNEIFRKATTSETRIFRIFGSGSWLAFGGPTTWINFVQGRICHLEGTFS